MAKAPTTEAIAPELIVPERVLLFCLASDTNWVKAGARSRALSLGGPAGEPKAEPTNDLLLFPDKNVVDLLPVWWLSPVAGRDHQANSPKHSASRRDRHPSRSPFPGE